MTHPIRLLLVSSNPTGEDSLDIDKEKRVVEQIAWLYPDAIDIIPCSAAQASDLVDPLGLQPQIVHIIAHGSDDAKLQLMDVHGTIKPIADDHLKALFRNAQTRLVLLMACYSEFQAKAISTEVDCVIGMNYKVSNQAASSFVRHFYTSLLRKSSIQQAFDTAITKMQVDDDDEYDVPVILVRPGHEAKKNLVIFDAEIEQREEIKGTIASEVSTKVSAWDGARVSKDSDWTTFRVPAGYAIDRDKIVVKKISERGSEHSYKLEYADYVEIIPGTGIKWPTTIRVQTHARSSEGSFGGGGGMKISVDFVYVKLK